MMERFSDRSAKRECAPWAGSAPAEIPENGHSLGVFLNISIDAVSRKSRARALTGIQRKHVYASNEGGTTKFIRPLSVGSPMDKGFCFIII
ncbi:hypothetical protein NOM01_00750 [Sporolactobacillus sp. STSJ-5]|uniref:hypothetical protein n=1 Tax=Sporolactobacillus sp. STSJ-5 TaxID=2965076 RepID=UPI0021043ECF|nr:hypothetical protein [Sporolactobacillus sp. STSJ-5]MCQ2008515.1 hypothetical protein [Sporolactobacillus sp. STSJ-5]